MNRRIVLVLIMALLALVTGAGVAWLRNNEPARIDKPVEKLFARQFADANGHTTDLNAYRGKVLVINFWATWCAPCIEEMPEISELQVELIPKGVQMLGLGIDTAPKILAFSQKVKVLYPLLVLGAAGMDLSREFGNANDVLPFTVVIDRNGEIVDRKIGRIDKARMRRVIQRTLDS